MVFDNLGNLYGMTPTGGSEGAGVIFQLAPQTGGHWKETVIHTFTGGADGGSASSGRLLIDAQRNIFGVATVGGANGAGNAFELSPDASGNWTFTTIYAFTGTPDAGFPYGGLLSDASGNLYGTTYYDGANNLGCVYKLSHAGSAWTEQLLYSFKGGDDGASSISGLVFGQDNNLYCTTSEGGVAGDYGTIVRLSPRANGTWVESVAYRFKGMPDAATPYAGLVADPAGNLYGATVHGGTDNEGAVYRFKP